MNPDSGRLYTRDEFDEMPPSERAKLVQVVGTHEQVLRVAAAVKGQRRAANRQARISRRRNR